MGVNIILRLLTSISSLDSRQKFMRVKDACEAYHMSRPKIMEETLTAGALYRLNKTILINVNIFDEYLETCRIPGEMM